MGGSRRAWGLGAWVVLWGAPAWAQGPGELPSFGDLLLQAILSLGLVCGLAYVLLRFGLGRWLQRRAAQGRHLAQIEVLVLGPRRAVYLLRARDRLLVVGSSEEGLRLLSDFGPGSAQGGEEAQGRALGAGGEEGSAQDADGEPSQDRSPSVGRAS